MCFLCSGSTTASTYPTAADSKPQILGKPNTICSRLSSVAMCAERYGPAACRVLNSGDVNGVLAARRLSARHASYLNEQRRALLQGLMETRSFPPRTPAPRTPANRGCWLPLYSRVHGVRLGLLPLATAGTRSGGAPRYDPRKLAGALRVGAACLRHRSVDCAACECVARSVDSRDAMQIMGDRYKAAHARRDETTPHLGRFAFLQRGDATLSRLLPSPGQIITRLKKPDPSLKFLPDLRSLPPGKII